MTNRQQRKGMERTHRSKPLTAKQKKSACYHGPNPSQDIMYKAFPGWLEDEYQFYSKGPHICCLKNTILSNTDACYKAAGIMKFEDGTFLFGLMRETQLGLCVIGFLFEDGSFNVVYRLIDEEDDIDSNHVKEINDTLTEAIGKESYQAGLVIARMFLSYDELHELFDPIHYQKNRCTCGSQVRPNKGRL